MDGKTRVCDALSALQEESRDGFNDKNAFVLNLQRGTYLPWWVDKKDDTVFICHESVDMKALYDALYNSDFGYTFTNIDLEPWVSKEGEQWLGNWAGCSNKLPQQEATMVNNCDGRLYTFMGNKERLSRSILIMAGHQ
ncbi:MAG: hypothetical protein E6K54_08445, partial [Gammaproteobacteria bacterium]